MYTRLRGRILTDLGEAFEILEAILKIGEKKEQSRDEEAKESEAKWELRGEADSKSNQPRQKHHTPKRVGRQ